jgi:hypothetical protein
VISLAEDVRDIAGWPAIGWGMTEEEVREALAGRVSQITPIAKFANSYAPIKGSVTIEGYPFEVVPQFSHATGELCQVLFRAADADAERIARMSDLLTACYGRPVEGETKRTWWGPGAAVELDTVRPSSVEEQLWLRWYPVPETEGG